jgi:SAM-dependent methyltransferase
MTRTINKGTPVLSKNPLELWKKAAGQYIDNLQGVDAFFRYAYSPVIDAMIGNVNDKDILDAGCVNGFFSKKLAFEGAYVLSIDGSSEMICRAEQENGHPMATYNVMDLTRPLPLESESMDVILANMVLMDLPEIETCVAEFSRILRKNGIFIISITHPAFFSSDWTGDESNPKL